MSRTRRSIGGGASLRRAALGMAAVVVVGLMSAQSLASASPASSPSVPLDPARQLHVPAAVSELPLPPTVPVNGVCTNPTGCVTAAWGGVGSPGLFWNPHYVLVGITYAGAPAAPNPASIYNGPQVLLVSTDGAKFPNGDRWKCITCGVPAASETGIISSFFTYPPPHGLPGNKQVLVGNGILDCGPYLVTDPRCTPSNTRIYPIYLGSQPIGAGNGFSSNGREWRLSPDGVHLAWDVLSLSTFTEAQFEGRLVFDQANQRYNLVSINYLPQTSPYVIKSNNQLKFKPVAMIGELRGWSADGKSILGIQANESDNVDAWATSLTTGKSTVLTNHAEYTDPMSASPNGEWLLAEQVLGSGRMDFISGMQGIPPLTDQLSTVGYVSGIRNAGQRRFFSPWLVSPDRSQSEQVNAGSDPNWNAAADPAWLADSTAVVYTENLACGANITPTPCTASTEPGGRNGRLMIARFPTLRPSDPRPPAPISDTVPWAIPYTPGQALPAQAAPLPTGTYTLEGTRRGSAAVVITDNSTNSFITSIAVTYKNFSDKPGYVINGNESVQNNGTNSPFAEQVTWMENLTLSGRHTGTKVTSPNGFTLGSALLLQNNFQPTGTMTTTIDGTAYTQPADGS